MTLSIFPTLEGIDWNTVKKPEFKTNVFETLSGKEMRYATRQYPKYTFKMSVTHLIEDREEQQLSALMGFVLNQQGMAKAFLFHDPNDNNITRQLIGTGDGVTTDFQLVRTLGNWTEPVENVNTITSIYLGNILITDAEYTVGDTGIVSFDSAIADGVKIYWTGSYYYRVRFLDDSYEFSQLMQGLHECKNISFVGSVRNFV